MTHPVSWMTVVILATGWILVSGDAAWAANAHFIPEASSAAWNGDTVTVTFREDGLGAGTQAAIRVDARGSIDGTCSKGDAVLIATHSSATVTDLSEYQADSAASVTVSRQLAMTVRPPVVSGLDCTMRITRTFSVSLRDIGTGATLELP